MQVIILNPADRHGEGMISKRKLKQGARSNNGDVGHFFEKVT